MPHETCSTSGHGMRWNERFPVRAASKDTVGWIPPTCQQLPASMEGSSDSERFIFKKIWTAQNFGFFLFQSQLLRPFRQATRRSV